MIYIYMREDSQACPGPAIVRVREMHRHSRSGFQRRIGFMPDDAMAALFARRLSLLERGRGRVVFRVGGKVGVGKVGAAPYQRSAECPE